MKLVDLQRCSFRMRFPFTTLCLRKKKLEYFRSGSGMKKKNHQMSWFLHVLHMLLELLPVADVARSECGSRALTAQPLTHAFPMMHVLA